MLHRSRSAILIAALVSFLIVFNAHDALAQTQPGSYKLYSKQGEPIDYSTLLDTLAESDVVFFGEMHNNPIAHWLQKRVTEELHTRADSLVLGAEMFEADNQLLLNEYLAGWIDEKSFEDEVRLWPNYETDYKPLVEYAKAQKLHFIATNIPGRYASSVYDRGLAILDSLSPQAKQYIAPLPINVNMDLPSYKKIKSMSQGHGHGGEKMVQAQAVKDATMAHFILTNLPADGTFLHYNGNYHSKNREGIVWYIEQDQPQLNITTIATVQQESITELDTSQNAIADYILCVPSDMTKTH